MSGKMQEKTEMSVIANEIGKKSSLADDRVALKAGGEGRRCEEVPCIMWPYMRRLQPTFMTGVCSHIEYLPSVDSNSNTRRRSISNKMLRAV